MQETELNETRIIFHAVSGKRVAEKFNVKVAEGLSNEEAARRLQTAGANIIKPKKKRGLWFLLV